MGINSKHNIRIVPKPFHQSPEVSQYYHENPRLYGTALDLRRKLQSSVSQKNSRFVVYPTNMPPMIRIENPIRYSYTKMTNMLSGIYIEDDGAGDMELKITLREGKLAILQSAWYDSVTGLQKLNVRNLKRSTVKDLSYGAIVYTISGSLVQLNAALTNMTYSVDPEDSLDPDTWISRPIQDINMRFQLKDGITIKNYLRPVSNRGSNAGEDGPVSAMEEVEEVTGGEHMAENTMLWSISDHQAGDLRVKVQNIAFTIKGVMTLEGDRNPTLVENDKSANKIVNAESWAPISDVCDFFVDRGGNYFYKQTEYSVKISSDQCTEFAFRKPIRTKESINTKLSTIPLLTDHGKHVALFSDCAHCPGVGAPVLSTRLNGGSVVEAAINLSCRLVETRIFLLLFQNHLF
jgi:hypothetical protein